MARTLRFSIWLVFLLMSLNLPAQTTVTLSPLKDNSIFSDMPGNSNAIGADLLAGNTSGLAPRRALIKFDVAATIPAGALITSVSLILNLNKIGPGAVASNVSLFKLLSDWGEGTSNAGNGTTADGNGTTATLNDVTWPCRFANGAGGCSQAWSVSGGDFLNTVSAVTLVGTSLVDYTWTSTNMVSDVQSWINSPASNFGWIIKGDETIATTARRYGSREYPVLANRPRLTVTYNSPAPVILTSFKGLEVGRDILLKWETSAEYNNAFFVVQHSLDGVTFTRPIRAKSRGLLAD